jgi:periplasmic protein TonB
MSADDNVLAADSAYALDQHLAAARGRRQPVFWLALSCAALAHAALIVGVGRSAPRYLGDPGGRSDAINVELVDEAELQSRASGSTPPDTQPVPAVPAAQPAQHAAEPPQPEPAPPTEAEAAQQSAALPPTETEQPELPSLPDAAAKPAPPQSSAKKSSAKKAAAKQQEAAKPVTKRAIKPPNQLDLSVPLGLAMRDASSGAQGGASSAVRPPGITRSGENDRFGHDVIRALKRTMPPPRGIKGRVTIRIFLNERGNIAKVQLVQSGGDSSLDESVVFSAHQASFPFPPNGATLADRTFLVTYVYR